MNRRITNLVRHLMDNYIPLAIRDNYYVMLPFYFYWFHGSPDIAGIMEFKKRVYSMTDEEFARTYAELKCRANERPTDCSDETLAWVMERLPSDPSVTLLDVGCGRGYWLRKLSVLGLQLTGCDIAR